MSALVGYGSSDEGSSDENLISKTPAIDEEKRNDPQQIQPIVPNGNQSHPDPTETAKTIEPSIPLLQAPPGPAVGPSMQASTIDNSPSADVPSSPYFASRANLRSLTLPPTPNLNIPPSPPGSPSADVETKVEHFLNLKKRGIHFNAKLASSSALKNPSLLPKLMDSAGLTEESAQYATTLPEDLWAPHDLPSWAYKEELAKTQQEVTKRKEGERKGAEREFVAATSTGSSKDTSSNGRNTNAAAERVMAGLDRKGPKGRERSPKRRRRSRSR